MTNLWTRTARACAALVAVSIMASSAALAAPEDDVLAAMNTWAETYATATSADPMLALYTPDAVFWGTGGRQPFVGPGDFAPYFANQFSNATDRMVTFHNPEIRVYGDGMFATSTGTYEFNVTLLNGQNVNVEHRYSFALVNEGGQWLIAQHHSSAMPPAQ
jgi:uncharacterized protein (TIGR02246 family)